MHLHMVHICIMYMIYIYVHAGTVPAAPYSRFCAPEWQMIVPPMKTHEFLLASGIVIQGAHM